MSRKPRAHFHRCLTGEGRTILSYHIGKVEGVMEMCADIEPFKEVAKRLNVVTVETYLFNETKQVID